MLAGFIAVLIAWIINNLYTYRFGLKGLSIAGPALEEILKTGGAILLQSNFIISHATYIRKGEISQPG